jgi:hypothetical protein
MRINTTSILTIHIPSGSPKTFNFKFDKPKLIRELIVTSAKPPYTYIFYKQKGVWYKVTFNHKMKAIIKKCKENEILFNLV